MPSSHKFWMRSASMSHRRYCSHHSIATSLLRERFIHFLQLAGVGVANNPLPKERSKVGADTADLEARLRQLHT